MASSADDRKAAKPRPGQQTAETRDDAEAVDLIAAAYQPPNAESVPMTPTLEPEAIDFPRGNLGLLAMAALGPMILFGLAIAGHGDPYAIIGILFLSIPTYLASCGLIAATLPGGMGERIVRFFLTALSSVLGYVLIFPVCMVTGQTLRDDVAIVLVVSASHMITVFSIGLIVRSSVRDAARQRMSQEMLESFRQP